MSEPIEWGLDLLVSDKMRTDDEAHALEVVRRLFLVRLRREALVPTGEPCIDWIRFDAGYWIVRAHGLATRMDLSGWEARIGRPVNPAVDLDTCPCPDNPDRLTRLECAYERHGRVPHV